MDISASCAVILIGLAGTGQTAKTVIPIRDTLSGVSYVILTVVFLIIIGGLSWCFYRALVISNKDTKDTDVQHPDEVGDEDKQSQPIGL